jgi:DNA-binding PadR family transcriptional regulator
LGGAVGAQRRKRRKISAQGLETRREPETTKDLKKGYDLTDKGLETQREPETAQGVLNDLKRDEEKEMIMDDLKTQLDVATPANIANFRQVFISDCKAYRRHVGYYISTART